MYVMCYRLGYSVVYPHNIDISFDREIHEGSDKLAFHRVPRKREVESLLVGDLFMVPGVTTVFATSPYTIQILHGAAFNRDSILSQVLAVLHMYLCPLEEMCELDPTTYSKEKGHVFAKLPSEKLNVFPPLFDEIDFDISL